MPMELSGSGSDLGITTVDPPSCNVTSLSLNVSQLIESSDCTCACSDTPAIIGGVVAIVLILSITTALTVIVIVLVRSRRGDYSTRSKGYEQYNAFYKANFIVKCSCIIQ